MQKHVLAKFKTQPQYNEPTTGFSNFFKMLLYTSKTHKLVTSLLRANQDRKPQK